MGGKAARQIKSQAQKETKMGYRMHGKTEGKLACKGKVLEQARGVQKREDKEEIKIGDPRKRFLQRSQNVQSEPKSQNREGGRVDSQVKDDERARRSYHRHKQEQGLQPTKSHE